MTATAPATIVILAVTAIATVLAFRNRQFMERWMFKPREILAGKQFERLLTSGFIHADWVHFGFNAFSFYSFGLTIEAFYGWPTLVAIHFSGIVGGSLLSLVIHRHEEYRALGASGGVCGVIFASVFLLPGGSIMLFLIPIPIPSYLYALAFPILSFVALRRQADNIGHDAHLGGAIIGLLVAAALHPSIMMESPLLFAAVLLISGGILCVLVFDPLRLPGRRFLQRQPPAGDERYHRYDEARERNRKMAEIDRLLEKVGRAGIHSLSRSERARLEQLSKEVGGR